MGKGSKQTFFQRYTNGQQVHEKVLNITNHEGIEIHIYIYTHIYNGIVLSHLKK